MAKFKTTTGISSSLEEIIKNAKEKLILISPYLKINELMKQQLEDKNRLKLDVRLIYGKNELMPDESNWLKTMSYIRTSFCKNLHAKCYLNENLALVTSMNLYEFSQQNNKEMGILVYKSEDPDLYSEIIEEANHLIRISEEVKVSVERVIPKEPPAKAKAYQSEKMAGKVNLPANGYCIRCKAQLKLDPKHPLCKECYSIWKQYDNPNFEEKHCHICGKTNKSTLLKPTCYDCYKKFKDVLSFSA